MGGRGRGRGRGNYKLFEQLGVDKSEITPRGKIDPTANPQDLFPHIDWEGSGVASERTTQQSYALAIRKGILENFQRSAYYLKPEPKRFGDFNDALRLLGTEDTKLQLHCKHNLPKELVDTVPGAKTAARGTKRKKVAAKRKRTSSDPLRKIGHLEDAEFKSNREGEGEGSDGDEEAEDEEGGEGEGEEDGDPDDELDEGTDYVVNHFDDDMYDVQEDALEDEGCF